MSHLSHLASTLRHSYNGLDRHAQQASAPLSDRGLYLASTLTHQFLLLKKVLDKTMLIVMFALIVLVVFGIGVAFFATQNTQTISITLANYQLSGIPLYLIVLGSLLLGFVVSWIISFIDVISSALKIHGKESTIKEANKQISELTKKVHQLELENERLKAESGHPSDDKSL